MTIICVQKYFIFILKMCVNVIQNTKKIEIHVHHFHCGKLFQLFPFYAPSVGAYRFAHVRPSVHTLIRISCVSNPYIYKGILTKLSQMVHLNMLMRKKHFYLWSVFTELWPLIGFDYIHV